MHKMKIYKSLINIEKKCPELFNLIKYCEIKSDEKIQTACATLRAGKIEILIYFV